MIDVALCLAYFANHFFPLPSATFLRLLDIDGESSFANWYSSTKLFAIAALFSIFAFRNFDKRIIASVVLWIFPALFLLLSADESVQIHEWLGRKTDVLLPGGDRENTTFHITGIWMFAIGLPFLASFLVLVRCARRYFSQSPDAAPRLVLGIIVLLSGAVGVEILTNWFSEPGTTGFLLEVCAEELLEMLGATIIVWGALTLLQSSGFAIHLDAARKN